MLKKPQDCFHRDDYLDINNSRFEHLDLLGIDFSNKAILEVGAGIGDHTNHLLKYGPKHIHATDIREENIQILRNNFQDNPLVSIGALDMESPPQTYDRYDICYCYGLLYHLSEPKKAIEFMSKWTKDILLLETCVDYSYDNSINNIPEEKEKYSQSYHGYGCRPGRKWIYRILKKYFDFVYIPWIQPNHEQFPLDWSLKNFPDKLTRSIFIASSMPLKNILYSGKIPKFQLSCSDSINTFRIYYHVLKNYLSWIKLL